MNVEHWLTVIENIIQNELPNNICLKKSYFPEGEFGELFRFEFESSRKVGALECWSNGAVSVDLIDLEIEDDAFIIFCLPDEIDKINDSLAYFFKVLKSGN